MTRKLRNAAHKLTAAEADATESVAPGPGKPLGELVTAVGKLGDQPELRTLSVAVIGAGFVTANRRLVRAGIRMILAHELATLAKDIIKKRLNRTRPRSANVHSQRKLKVGERTAKEETSFPSGHSSGASAVARALSREFPEHALPALAAGGLVAAAQVPRRAHYPTDVAAGVVLGLASEAVAHLVVGERVEAPTRHAARRPPRLRA